MIEVGLQRGQAFGVHVQRLLHVRDRGFEAGEPIPFGLRSATLSGAGAWF